MGRQIEGKRTMTQPASSARPTSSTQPGSSTQSGSARADILLNLRRALGVSGSESIRKAAVDERIERAPKGLIPARGQLNGGELLALFRAQAEDKQATVEFVKSAKDVPQAAASYLRDHNLPASLRMGDDARLSAMPWTKTALEITKGPSAGDDLNAVSHAYGGVAETGTLVMLSGPDNPTTLNFLPDNHIIVVRSADITSDYEAVWQRLRGVYGKSLMPRTVNWITGPSRSGDIEQTLLLGAHGPRNLHIIVVEC
jgi:L-lactate dehydrogenase complex protein LldG